MGRKVDATMWDLRERLSRADVGMKDGERVAIYETADPRDVTVRLPAGRSLRVPATLATFDSYLVDPNEPAPDPLGMNVHTDLLDLDGILEQYTRSLNELGLPVDRADEFRAEIAAADPESISRMRSPYAATNLGYVRVWVQARYVPSEENGTLAYSLSWKP